MGKAFDINKILESKSINNELELERALVAERKLCLLSKTDSKYALQRKELRDIIAQYENEHWPANQDIPESQLSESDNAERLAEKEREFVDQRKALIRKRPKTLGLNQQEFGKILGHSSKSYTSELLNGLSPLSLKDTIVIHRLLKIDLGKLIPIHLSNPDLERINLAVKKLGKPKLKFGTGELMKG